MAIVGNGGYHSPELAAAAQNIAQMFAPPSAQDTAAYSVAAKNRQETEMRAQLAQLAGAENFDREQFDRMGMVAGNWNPTQSFYKVNLDDATTRRGQDVTAATSIQNNELDNRTDLIVDLYGSRDPYHTQPALPGDIASSFGIAEVPATPGLPKPLSMTEWQASHGQRLYEGGKITDDDLMALITDGGDGSAKEQQIERLRQNFMATGDITDPTAAYNAAVGIADGRYHMSSDPITGEVLITDLATRRPVDLAAPSTVPAPSPAALPGPAAPAGNPAYEMTGDPVIDAVLAPGPTIAAAEARGYAQPYPATEKAFGVEGFLAGGINRAADGLGMDVPYPETQQTQADFNVLRENLLNAVQEAYGRQPPSWLMQRLDQLTPDTGNPLEGAGQGRVELEALGRAFANDLQSSQAALETRLTPSVQMETEARVRGLEKALTELDVALRSFPGGDRGPAAPMAPPDADGWVTAPNGARIREVQ